MRGQLSPDGATRVAPNGYHYTKVKGKWVLTHRLTAEKGLGRPLEADERVTFKDNDRTNFADFNNLIIAKIKPKTTERLRARFEARLDELNARDAEVQENEIELH